MTTTPTLTEIRAAAEQLGAAHLATTARASLMQDEIRAAIAPIVARHRAGLDAAAEEEARAHEALQQLLAVAPHLFVKPRTITVNGVRAGYRKAEDTLDWVDEAAVIARIRSLLPDQADILIRTEESLVIDALARLDAKALRSIGVATITGVDQPVITIGDADVEKLAKTLLADAIRRQGEDDAPKKKGKAKAKAMNAAVAA